MNYYSHSIFKFYFVYVRSVLSLKKKNRKKNYAEIPNRLFYNCYNIVMSDFVAISKQSASRHSDTYSHPHTVILKLFYIFSS